MPKDPVLGVTDAMASASKAVVAATKQFLTDAGAVARDELKRTSTIVPGRDRRFSRFGRGGMLSVKTRMSGPSMLLVIPVGPWGIAETGARPHTAFMYGHRFDHPGTLATQGRQSWTVGREATFNTITRQFEPAVGEAVEQAFEGS